MSSVLYIFLSNVFDLDVSPEFMNQFIKDNQLDLDTVLKHHLLFYNLLYCHTWKYIFKTWPTKKDFSKYQEEYKFPLDKPEPVNGQLLQTIVNSFFPLRLGYVKKLDTNKLVQYIDKIIEKKYDTSFIQDFVIEKLCYRFNEQRPIAPNLFYMFVSIYKSYTSKQVKIVKDDRINPIAHTVNETLVYDEFDKKYLSEYEKVHHIIHKDNHMYVKSNDATAIIIDTCIPIEVLKDLIDRLEDITKRNVTIFNLTSTYYKHDTYFNFMVSREMIKYIPAMFEGCFLISSKRLPEVRSLSRRKDTSIHYIYNYKESDQTTISKEIIDEYDRAIVNDMSLLTLDAHMKVYYMPKTYIDKEENPYSFVHSIVMFTQDTFDRHQPQIESFAAENKINVCVANPGKFKADFVIDLYNQLDTIEYNYNGVIPFVGQASPYIVNSVNGYVNNNIDSIFEAIKGLYESPHLIKEFKENCKIVQSMYHDVAISGLFKRHIELSCPFNDISPKNNLLIYHNFVYQYFWKNLEKVVGIRMAKESENVVVLVDNRPNALSVASVLFTLANIKTFNWVCKIYTSKKGLQYYKKHLGRYADIIQEPLLDVNVFHIDIYNELLKSRGFWKGMKAERCLIIQDDGVILRPGIEQFLQFDYVGAPWADAVGNEYLKNEVNPDMVGNGGLSLRSVPRMIEVIEKFESEKRLLFFKNINIIPEDVYFSKGLKKIGANLPTTENALAFSSEQLCYMESLGFHKLWGYFNSTVVKQYLDKALG